jgi:hypothetical protein
MVATCGHVDGEASVRRQAALKRICAEFMGEQLTALAVKGIEGAAQLVALPVSAASAVRVGITPGQDIGAVRRLGERAEEIARRDANHPLCKLKLYRRSLRRRVVRRYDVYLMNLDPTLGSEIKKTRPCLVIWPDEMNRHIRTVIIAPMTSVRRDYPSRVDVTF